MANIVKYGLFVMLEANAGKEQDVENFLRGALPLVEEEPGTVTWYAVRLSPSTFGIFDTFADEKGREAHLFGKVAAALMEKGGELLSKPPKIEKIEVLTAKIPGATAKSAIN